MRRRVRIYAIVLMGFIIFFAALRSQEVIFVFFLYAAIFSETFMLLISISVSDAKGSGERDNETRNIDRPFDGNNIIESLNVYVKYAARGSEFSRREIALILRKLMSDNRDPEGRETMSIDPQFQKDLWLIVDAYLDERSYIQRTDKPNKDYAAALKIKGDAYLTSLERIVTRLRSNIIG